jgi:hypothetical protein
VLPELPTDKPLFAITKIPTCPYDYARFAVMIQIKMHCLISHQHFYLLKSKNTNSLKNKTKIQIKKKNNIILSTVHLKKYENNQQKNNPHKLPTRPQDQNTDH